MLLPGLAGVPLCDDAPSYLKQGRFSRWIPWFAWWPVDLEQGGSAWLIWVWRRHVRPASWFLADLMVETAYDEYSLIARGLWDWPERSIQPTL